MADFKTHLAGGLVVSAAITWFLKDVNVLNAVPYIVSGGLIGSIFPDIDSDTSKSVKYLFNSFALLFTFSVSFILYQNSVMLKKIIFISLALPVIILVILKPFFKKLTVHRGIFHSIPMGLVISLLILSLNTHNTDIISIAFMGGFLSHLILDEAYSSITISGIIIKPKKSFGTALKWFSSSVWINIFINSLLLFLIFRNYKLIQGLFKYFL